MEQIYKPLLLFIALNFGFILLFYSEFLRRHDKLKKERIIIRILGIALILFFLFQGDFLKLCWESVFDVDSAFLGVNKVNSFSQDVAIWEKWVSERSLWFLLPRILVLLLLSLFCLGTIFIDFDFRQDELKELDIFNIVFWGYINAFCLVFGIYCLFQLGSFTMAIGYKLFY